jgi:hypothetical protein
VPVPRPVGTGEPPAHLQLLHGVKQRINGPLDPILGQPLLQLLIGFEPVRPLLDRTVDISSQRIDVIKPVAGLGEKSIEEPRTISYNANN